MKNVRSLFGLVVIFLFTVSASQASMIKLAGTEWGFSEEIGATARLIEFGSDGRVSGLTGCNRFTGTYSQDGSALTIGTLGTTRRACLPEVMKREQQFLGLLSRARRAEGTHLKLTLKDADGAVLVELVRRDPDY
jgi:heat shock protein HslJ